MKALALIFDGFEELEAMAPFTLLRRAKIDLTIASNNNTVTGSHNISLTNIVNINDINYKDYDCLIIPGGPHFKYLRIAENVHEMIKYFMENNMPVAAICAAPTIIGQLGYLKNRSYTCFTSMNADFGGNHIDKPVVVDGNLITGRSAAASIDFAYEIIRLIAGDEVLAAVQAQIYYEK